MNTFVIKSKIKLNGQYIGMSPDGLWVYIFRSHKVFKDTNPDIKSEYFIVMDDPIEKDFDFKKNNVCPCCGALKAWYHVASDKSMNGNILYDEDGFTLFSEKVCVNCTCGDGTYIGHLEHNLQMLERESKECIDDLSLKLLNLQCYVKSKSTCKTCRGNQDKMYNHEKCEECGLPGTQLFICGG